MADLGGTYDATAKENNPDSVIPAGEYRMTLVKSEKKRTKSGDGEYLNCEFRVTSGEHQNAVIFQMFHLWNKSEKAVGIARGQFSELCRAVGVLSPKDSSELHNRPFIGKVKVRDDDEFGKKNEMRGYEAVQANPVIEQVAPTQQAVGNAW